LFLPFVTFGSQPLPAPQQTQSFSRRKSLSGIAANVNGWKKIAIPVAFARAGGHKGGG
jgi:hypothetical protein